MRLGYAVTAMAIAALALGGAALAANYQINWYSISSGGGTTSQGAYRIDCTVGQCAAGVVSSGGRILWAGFWSGEPQEQPTPVASIAEAKLLPDGTLISISGKIATTGTTDFAQFFYIEEPTRSSGIRVAAPAEPLVDLVRGCIVNVIGRLGTTEARERQLVGPIVVIVGMQEPLTPVGMPVRSVGRDYGLSNVGLLIKTWGRVIDSGVGYAWIDDGSGSPLRVDTSALQAPPQSPQYISVIGISSLFGTGSVPVPMILPRDGHDLRAHPH